MEIGTRMQLEARQAAVRRAGPRLIARNAILELPIMQLQQRIEEEIAENPALELAEDQCCPVCALPLEGPFCRNCGYTQLEQVEADPSDLEPELHFAYTTPRGEQEEDPVSFLESEFTLHDYLCLQARAAASQHLYPLVEYLVHNVNADGYLECDLVEAAARLGVEVARMQQALVLLQSLEPPGIGARGLQECLLLQAQVLREEGQQDPYAERILRDCWRLLSSRAYARIAHRLDITLEEVQASLAFIRNCLFPCPGLRFRPPWHWKARNPKAIVRPDVIITASPASPTGYRIEVTAGREAAVCLNEHYLLLYGAGQGGRQDPERQHVAECVERARRFLSYLEERQQTIRRITEQVAIRQRAFLETGSQAVLVPLTRAEVAVLTGLDESTVSRATGSKFVLLPHRQLVPYAMFFDASLALKSVIARLVANEGKDKPLSDRRLAEILAALGYTIARRTVAKYREAAGIPMAELRNR